MSTAVKTQGEVTAVKRGIQPQRQRGLSDQAIRNWFIWPTMILLIAMNVFPLVYSLYLSFTNYSAIKKSPPVWIAFDNFARVLNDEKMWFYFSTTGKYVLFTVTLQLLLGFMFALLTIRRMRSSKSPPAMVNEYAGRRFAQANAATSTSARA